MLVDVVEHPPGLGAQLLEEPLGAIQAPIGREIRVRGKPVRGERLLDDIDEAYAKLAEFFSMDQATKSQFVAPGSHGQTGYTGLLAKSRDVGDIRAGGGDRIFGTQPDGI